MPFEPIVPEGQRLGKSHNHEGAVTGHLFDEETNELKGHASWHWVDDEDYDQQAYEPEEPRKLSPEEQAFAEALAALIMVGIVLAVTAAAPVVKRFWVEKVVPTAKSTWQRVTRLIPRKGKKPTSQVATATDRGVFIASTKGVEKAIAKSKIRMSAAEWTARFKAMAAAGAFKDEQMRILSNAQIEEGIAVEGTQSSPEQLTPAQFAERVKELFEARPALLDEETTAELLRVFAPPTKPSKDQGMRELEQ